jgi:lipoate-protein ligase A
MLLLKSASDAPAYNCALEASLLTTKPPTQEAMLFYINRPSVIVGRNQCIEAEVDTAYCRAHGIDVVRRLSGGGAVYHDYGNINYAFIGEWGTTPLLDRDFTAPMIAALQSFGIPATVGVRKELLVNGKKISGAALHMTRDRTLFHATLLHDAHLEHLSRALQGDPSRRGRSVPSVPSPVMNLSELGATETTAEFLARLIAFFSVYYATEALTV